jgi:hypothetical protein
MNKKYYIIVEEIQEGPFSIEELKDFSLNKSDLIWFEDLEDWTPLEKIDELSIFINKVPPPFKSKVVSPKPLINEVKKIEKESFVQKFKLYIFCAVGFFILSIIVVSNQNNQPNSEQVNVDTTATKNISIPDVQKKEELSPNELREQLLNKEQSNPLKYLTVNGSMRENKVQIRNGTMFRSSKWKIDGYILEVYVDNSASLATFKDVKIVVSFISSTGSVISETNFIIYDYVPSKDGITYEQKIYAPENYSSYEISIADAKY